MGLAIQSLPLDRLLFLGGRERFALFFFHMVLDQLLKDLDLRVKRRT